MNILIAQGYPMEKIEISRIHRVNLEGEDNLKRLSLPVL